MTAQSQPRVIVGGVVEGVWSRKGQRRRSDRLDDQRRPDVASTRSRRLADVLGRDLQPRLYPERCQKARVAGERVHPLPALPAIG